MNHAAPTSNRRAEHTLFQLPLWMGTHCANKRQTDSTHLIPITIAESHAAPTSNRRAENTLCQLLLRKEPLCANKQQTGGEHPIPIYNCQHLSQSVIISCSFCSVVFVHILVWIPCVRHVIIESFGCLQHIPTSRSRTSY